MSKRPNPPHGSTANGLASEFIDHAERAHGSYAAGITSSETAWHILSTLFRPLPIAEQIDFLGTIYHNLHAEYERQFKETEAQAREESRPGPVETTFWMSNREAHALMLRAKAVLDLLVNCGEVPDYSYPELMAKLDTLEVDARRRYVRALLDRFPGRDHEQWTDVYGTPEAVRASGLSQWTPFHWNQLRAYVEELEQNYNKLLRQERSTNGAAGTTGEARRKSRRIRVASSDTDLVRVAEALKAAGIIEPGTTGPQIVAAFEWLGRMNEKPGNYDAFKSQLDRPPSPEIISLVKALLAGAGDDLKQEVITFLKRR